MDDGRELMEKVAAGDFDENVRLTLSLAAHLILRNLDAGKKPDADVALGLAKKRGRPRVDGTSDRDFDIALRLAQARADDEPIKSVEPDLQTAHGIKVDAVRKAAKKHDRQSMDRFYRLNALRAEIVAHIESTQRRKLTDEEWSEITGFVQQWYQNTPI